MHYIILYDYLSVFNGYKKIWKVKHGKLQTNKSPNHTVISSIDT